MNKQRSKFAFHYFNIKHNAVLFYDEINECTNKFGKIYYGFALDYQKLNHSFIQFLLLYEDKYKDTNIKKYANNLIDAVLDAYRDHYIFDVSYSKEKSKPIVKLKIPSIKWYWDK